VSLNATSGVSTPWTPSVSDPNGDPLTCSIASPASHGTATVNANCSGGTYTSTNGYTGGDSFTYVANDGQANSAPATVTVTVSAGGGGGGVALVQQQSASGSAATLPVTLNQASTGGNTLVAEVAIAAGSSAWVSSVTDSGGGAWLKGPVGFLSGTNSRVEIWYRLGGPSATTVTVILSAAKSAAVNVSEWSGVTAVDTSAAGNGASSTTAATPALATSNATDLVIGAINYPAGVSSTLAAGSFTGLTDFSYLSSVHGRAAYLITSSTGSYQASWTLTAASGGNGGAILALKTA
jgi:Bacterial Ig domain